MCLLGKEGLVDLAQLCDELAGLLSFRRWQIRALVRRISVVLSACCWPLVALRALSLPDLAIGKQPLVL